MARSLFFVEKPTIEEMFWEFHTSNPHVLPALYDLAMQLKRRGHKKYSIAGLFEVLRFHRALKTTGEDFKLNNNYRAHYARKLMLDYPELDGFFNLRVVKSP